MSTGKEKVQAMAASMPTPSSTPTLPISVVDIPALSALYNPLMSARVVSATTSAQTARGERRHSALSRKHGILKRDLFSYRVMDSVRHCHLDRGCETVSASTLICTLAFSVVKDLKRSLGHLERYCWARSGNGRLMTTWWFSSSYVLPTIPATRFNPQPRPLIPCERHWLGFRASTLMRPRLTISTKPKMLYTVVIVGVNQTSVNLNNYLPDSFFATITPAQTASAIYGSKWAFATEICKVTMIWGCKACMLILYNHMTWVISPCIWKSPKGEDGSREQNPRNRATNWLSSVYQ